MVLLRAVATISRGPLRVRVKVEDINFPGRWVVLPRRRSFRRLNPFRRLVARGECRRVWAIEEKVTGP